MNDEFTSLKDANELVDNNLTHPIKHKNGTWDNPWEGWRFANLKTVLNWKLWDTNHTNLPNDHKVLDQKLPVHNVTDDEIDEFYKDSTDKVKLLWIGHATCLVNIENCVVLIDPVFSERCSPSQHVGPKRFRPVPITIERIPRVDAVIISHNHYDHLDYNSVSKLNEKFCKKNADGDDGIHWFVGAGLKSWFTSCGIKNNVNELEWWQSKIHKNINFTFTIAQHWSGRHLTDRCKSLWGSWTLVGPNKRFFFAGDTGYCPSFTEIGNKYGPFDLAAIPIGAYEPRYMMEPQHVDPDQAVQIHIDIKSKKSIGVHWGTFALANEYYLEPIEKLKEALEKHKLDPNSFITLGHGQFYETQRE